MKSKILLLPALFSLTSFSLPVIADQAADIYSASAQQSTDTNTKNLVEYVKNLGLYFGYDITKNPPGQQNISDNLLDLPGMKLFNNYLFNTFLGALVAYPTTSKTGQLVPGDQKISAAINAWVNYTFNNPPYNSDSQTSGKISISSLVDQKPYQSDPVSQAVLDMLTTPDNSYCPTGAAPGNNGMAALTSSAANCPPLYDGKVMANILGTLPTSYYDPSFNQQVLGQLNSNSLITPLLYSFQNIPTSGNSNTLNKNPGLTAQNQAQQAANFVRYATSTIAPIILPKKEEYEDLFIKANNLEQNVNPSMQTKAQNTLNHYMASLRVYAAQRSVAVGNLYSILSKRMPQNQSLSSGNPAPTSQALAEFTMATKRLYNPEDMTQNSQWIDKINKASAATVQKEMALLLAEINYQLYLNRQEQERLLLTNTMVLMQEMRDKEPTVAKSIMAITMEAVKLQK